MSDYIKDSFARMNLQQLRSFLLYGTDDYADETHPYRDTLKKGCDPIFRRLDILYPNETERDKAAADLSQALTAYEHVYMELGMKAGARLLHQLLLTDDQPQMDIAVTRKSEDDKTE